MMNKSFTEATIVEDSLCVVDVGNDRVGVKVCSKTVNECCLLCVFSITTGSVLYGQKTSANLIVVC